MYLRHTTVRKNGKTHTYWRLVRSVRVGHKVRQETVACLGELNARGRARARALAAKVCGRPVQGELFELDYELLLYDVTSTYFEGEAAGNEMARRGHSRDGRPDCKQVCIGLVVTTDGMPLGYEVFAGNRNDVTTVEEIIEAVEAKYGRARRIWVMDRGMVSQDNLEFLASSGRRYIVGTPRSELKRFGRELLAGPWSAIREGLEVQLCPGPDGQETFILCRSADRGEKEKAIRERFAARIVEAVTRLQCRLRRARKPARAADVSRQIGRLLERNRRASAASCVPTRPKRRFWAGWDSACRSGFARPGFSRKCSDNF